ncbi:MAG TPA: hypothetical protein VFR58_02430 [Flavisolibacter sp.]|nr:hypothetical protein [Flavisolibacter sp.]
MKNNHQVLVFKTNLSGQREVEAIGPVLSTIPAVLQWNVDLMDVDKVLRVVAPGLEPAEIISLVCGQGYNCEELPD